MPRQSLMWTTLPNGIAEDGRPRVSVLLSPRLDAEAAAPELSSFFPDWEDWPTTIARATFHITYGGATFDIRAVHADTSLYGGRDSAVWAALFHADLFVRGFEFQDLSSHHVLSYDTTSLATLLRGLYGRLAESANGHMPLVSDIIDDPTWNDLVHTVAALDREFANQDTGLRDSGREFDAFRRTRLDRGGLAARTLATMQLFHTPLGRPFPMMRPRPEDDRVHPQWLEYARTPLPKKEDLAKQLDFHQVVSAMNAYPTLLRRLGLVVDFLLDRGAMSDAADAPLVTTVDFEGDLVGTRTPDASPVTHARLQGNLFEAVSDPLLGPGSVRVQSGLLDLDPTRFDVLQVDVDGAGLKLMSFLRSLQRLEPSEERVDPVTRIEKDLGAPALRTAGLMLVQRERGDALQDRFANNKIKNDSVENVFKRVPGAVSPELWAEDLVRGFRIDVWDARNSVWRSLCRRDARYELADGAVVVIPDPEEETILRLGATQSPDPTSNPDIVKLHESLVSWTGWSLAAPPTGRAVQPDDGVDEATTQSEAEVPPGLHFLSRFRPVRGSLPRLRFGRQYWMRARSVDLAGNSLDHQEADFGPENPRLNARAFQRFEPVVAPAIALVKQTDGTTLLPAEGESMLRLAIRSFNDTPADNAVTTTQVARRFAVPQRVSARDAELHGKLDTAGKVDATAFDLLANQKDLDATDPGSSLIQETINSGGPLAAGAVATHLAVYREGQSLTYLPDPLAEVVAARFFHHPTIPESKILAIPLYPASSWPDAAPFQIELFEDPAAAPEFDAASRTLRVPLAKGERAQLRLSMQLSRKMLHEIMGLWPWLSAKAQASLEEMTLAGQHWMFTPWHTLNLVHAVQRPLIAPELIDLTILRSLNETSARPVFLATCSIKSTDRVDLFADWHEPSDNPAAPESHDIGVDHARREVAFSIKVTDPNTYATVLDGHPRGGVPEHMIAGPDLIRIGEAAHNLTSKTHEFHDTRYRRIEYWLEATSQFREFMPPELLAEVTSSGAEATDKHIKVVGPHSVTWIPNSAPPPSPQVLYVVPTFGWARAVDAQGNASHWRRGGGLRVYLDRPWNASGYGEMLAVLLPPSSFAGDPEAEPTGAPYKQYVTQWGNDPIWQSSFVAGLAPRRGNFPLARTAADPTGAWLPAGAPSTESDQPPDAFVVSGVRPAGVPLVAGTTVEIAPHDVFFDSERQLWYCDIEIEQGGSYWPFIRLALARYQPTSVTGAHLSQAVLADFMPLTADRWLTVVRSDARRRHISVFGFGYSDSSGHDEAAKARPMSVIDVLQHRVFDLTPVRISATTVFEVWVEQLDPAQGEDFGWQRVPGARVHATFPAPEPAPHVAAGGTAATGFVPADVKRRALDLQQNRRFAELASARLVGNLFNFLLQWEGDVELPPEAPADGRFRLVIAEYEEYPVDDDPAYFKVPTRKDRRLVFVEHVDFR